MVEDESSSLEGVEPGPRPWQRAIFDVVFGTDTKSGAAFDVALLVTILVSVVATLLESVESLRMTYGQELFRLDVVITVLFSVEFIIRCLVVRSVRSYVFSFFGFVDVLAILPAYIGFFGAGGRELVVLRALRLLRIFRVLHLGTFLQEARHLRVALAHSRHRILVFFGAVLILVVNLGALMYIIEGPEHGFTSIPRAIYWAIVTLTTVGYGDIAPETPLGQAIAAIVMIIGYSIIAVPTGIVSVELAEAARESRACRHCGSSENRPDARFCSSCGERLGETQGEVRMEVDL